MEAIQLSQKQILIIGIIIFLIIIYYMLILRYWLRCILSGVTIKPIEILFMRLRKTPVDLIIQELIKAHKSGILIKRDELEACYLSGGNVKNVVNGLIYAKSKNIKLDLKEAFSLDMQKEDIIKYLKNK